MIVFIDFIAVIFTDEYLFPNYWWYGIQLTWERSSQSRWEMMVCHISMLFWEQLPEYCTYHNINVAHDWHKREGISLDDNISDNNVMPTKK